MRTLYDRAHSVPHTKNATLMEEWRLSQDGQTGTFRVRRLGKDYRETTTLGPLVYENGVHGGVRWQQNRNGISFTFAGIHERDAVDERAWESPSSKEVRLIGESLSANAYVVSINPRKGRHEWLFIEKRTGVVVRRERIERHRRYITSYEDFRQFDGTLEPSRTRTTDTLGNEREQTIVKRSLDTTPDPKDVEMPPTRRTLVEFPNGANVVRLPVRIANGLFVVRVAVAGHPYDFLLDSGAAGIVIDPSIADALALERYGSRVGSTLGSFAEQTSIVPLLTIGALHMRNIVTRVVPVPFRADDRTKIAGLLGFDFFADAVVHIDHEHNLFEAHQPASWRPPSDATPVPLALDDKQPAIRAKVGTVAARVILDTGANRTVLETAFADRADITNDKAAMVAKFRGVGGIGTAETVRIKTFEFAGTTFSDPLIDISPSELGVEDIDGILGTDLLRDYDMYFDYRANMAYLHRVKRAPSTARVDASLR
ncbi:MAG: retroviral-like aspartic protease family protein [Candidatus Velthaea sp.]